MIEMRPEDLPGVLADMAEIAGVEKALEYAAMFGGPVVYIPRVFQPDHRECWGLAVVFGEDDARRIVERIGGGEVALPNAQEQRILYAAAKSDKSIKELCRALGVTQRTVLRARAKLRAIREMARQEELFGG